MLIASFLLGLLLDPEDGGNILLRNVRLSPKYRASQSGQLYSLHISEFINSITKSVFYMAAVVNTRK
jgi:hypothetical protein